VVQLRKWYAGHETEGGSFVSWRLATADDTPVPTLDEYIANWMERDRLREELLCWMETTPLIIAPVGATPAYRHDTLKVTVRETTMGTFRAFSYAQAFNVFDLPVVTVPPRKIERRLADWRTGYWPSVCRGGGSSGRGNNRRSYIICVISG
jgi:Asp-tRNA(Asn)/Glu-tRNA(Gln) amidotransferase A subunit family amidase